MEIKIKKYYWMWKTTTIDFSKIPDEHPDGCYQPSKKDYIFRYLPLPDEELHEWYNGGWSSEYNDALYYAREYGLIKFVDEDEEDK